ncbi:hypothetical protein QQP08_022833 [Theobroma cacao]|nr:hypothetical protein QQP08_022833 [Theobroma cacao]
MHNLLLICLPLWDSSCLLQKQEVKAKHLSHTEPCLDQLFGYAKWEIPVRIVGAGKRKSFGPIFSLFISLNFSMVISFSGL